MSIRNILEIFLQVFDFGLAIFALLCYTVIRKIIFPKGTAYETRENRSKNLIFARI